MRGCVMTSREGSQRAPGRPRDFLMLVRENPGYFSVLNRHDQRPADGPGHQYRARNQTRPFPSWPFLVNGAPFVFRVRLRRRMNPWR